MNSAEAPEDLHKLFVQALNSGDLDGLIALYAFDGFLTARGGPARGISAIRKALAEYVAMKPTIQLTTRKVVQMQLAKEYPHLLVVVKLADRGAVAVLIEFLAIVDIVSATLPMQMAQETFSRRIRGRLASQKSHTGMPCKRQPAGSTGCFESKIYRAFE